nr:transglutaminase-like domain-containing protein [Plantibacter sp. VKM Ac-2885]
MEADSLDLYLVEDDVFDWSHPAVVTLTDEISVQHIDDLDYARAVYEHVRDSITHSWDAQDPRMSISGSDALISGTGLCHAKAHLLVALLRARGIPAGLAYQRLTDDGSAFVIHGLVAVWIEGGWHRIDPRGNKFEVDAQFSLTDEQLAWPVRPELGERDYEVVYSQAHPAVIASLKSTNNVLEVQLPQAI